MLNLIADEEETEEKRRNCTASSVVGHNLQGKAQGQKISWAHFFLS